MGALVEPTHSPALRIQHALDELTSGNSLEYLRLQHTLRGTNPTTLSPILSGLTHFAVKLHQDAPQKPLHALFNAALQIDLPTVAAHEITLKATIPFLQNLLSADASFVEPVLHLVTRALLLPVDGRDALIQGIHELISFLLSTHPRAAGLVVKVLKERYPHAVRPTEEHVPYMRGLLSLARRNLQLAPAITNAVFERLSAIEALVPSLLPDQPLPSEAEKIDKCLLEMFDHFDRSRGKNYHQLFEAAFSAYESFIVPCEPRFTPYIVLYGCELGGKGLTKDVIERLRSTFFDRGISSRVREKFLEHCCGFVVRARSVDSFEVADWLGRMAEWMHMYIDSTARRNTAEVDADVHHLFYTAFHAFLFVVVERRDVDDVFGELRIGRIVVCRMKPLTMVDEGLVERFLEIIETSLVYEVERGYKPSRTRFGRRNDFVFTERVPVLRLPEARRIVGAVCRFGDEEDGDRMEE